MRRLSKTVAGKWFLDNLETLMVSQVPEPVLDSLAEFRYDEIFEFACQLVGYKLKNMFEVYHAKCYSTECDDKLFTNDYDKFMVYMHESYFPDLEDPESVFDYLINKFCTVLNTLVVAHQGVVKFEADFNLWDIVTNQCPFFHVSGNDVDMGIKRTEKSYKEELEEALKNRDYSKAKKLMSSYQSIMERMRA